MHRESVSHSGTELAHPISFSLPVNGLFEQICSCSRSEEHAPILRVLTVTWERGPIRNHWKEHGKNLILAGHRVARGSLACCQKQSHLLAIIRRHLCQRQQQICTCFSKCATLHEQCHTLEAHPDNVWTSDLWCCSMRQVFQCVLIEYQLKMGDKPTLIQTFEWLRIFIGVHLSLSAFKAAKIQSQFD